MPNTVAFIEEPGKLTIDQRGVLITYRSGAEIFVRRMDIRDFRAFMADAQRQLNDYDASQRCRIVPLKKRKPGH